MWERFTEHAKHVVTMSVEHSVRLGCNGVMLEHLLLSICRESNCTAARVLKGLGIHTPDLACVIERDMDSGSPVAPVAGIEFTPGAKQLLERVVEKARRLNQSYIGTEHVVLAYLGGTQAGGDSEVTALAGGKTSLLKEDETAPGVYWRKSVPAYQDVRAEIVRILRESNRNQARLAIIARTAHRRRAHARRWRATICK